MCKKVEMATWSRREIYEMFSRLDYPFYSVTILVEVTKVKRYAKEKGLSFYYLMIWICTKAVNEVEAFNQRIRGDEVYQLDCTNPSFTAMRKDEDYFQIITMPFEQSKEKFCEKASKKVKEQTSLFGDAKASDELIYFSCTPWFDFTSLTNEHNFDKADTIPRIAWGKYFKEKDNLFVHLSIEVNHRTIDGYHIGLLKEAIDREISSL